MEQLASLKKTLYPALRLNDEIRSTIKLKLGKFTENNINQKT